MRHILGSPIQTMNISDNVNGNIETVKVMTKLALQGAEDPYVRAITEEVVKGLRSHAFADESRAIGAFVRDNVRYLQDPLNVERLIVPAALLKNAVAGHAQGDCDDMALLAATMLLSAGHDPVFRAVRYQGHSGPFNHIYVVDYPTNGIGMRPERVVLDCILKDYPIGYEIPHASGHDFPIMK